MICVNQPFKEREISMTSNAILFKKSLVTTILGATLIMSLSGCSSMSTRDKNTAIGAGVGAVAGAVLTGGSAWGTVGGAAVGGVIGNQIGRK
jgi:osmotically inducible lipoprotein OsmB